MYEFNLTKFIMEFYNLASHYEVDMCIDIIPYDRLKHCRNGITITLTKGIYHNSYRWSIEELARIDHPDIVMWMFQRMLNELLSKEARDNRYNELISGRRLL